MAIQIIEENKRPPKQKPPSMSDRFKNAFAHAVEVGSSTYLQRLESENKEKKQKQENEVIKALTGLDLEGIEDPETRKQFIQAAAKSKSKLGLMDELGFGGILSGSKGKGLQGKYPTQRNPSEQLQGMEGLEGVPEQENGINVNVPTMIPDEMIYTAELMGEHGLAQQMRETNKQVIADQHHEQNLELKREEAARKNKLMSPEYQREQQLNAAQSKVDVDYNKQLQQSASQHKIKLDTLNRLEALNKKGVTGKPYEKALEKMGLVNLTSSGRREFAADVKNLITDIRSILGSQFTGFEFQTILNAYPSADFSQDANSAIIRNLKEFQDIRHKEIEIANNLKKENGGKIPLDYQSAVNERLQRYVDDRLPEIKANTYEVMKEELGIPKENILMFSPDGEPLNVPATEVDKYESLGATIFPIGS